MKYIPLTGNEKVFAISPIGYTESGESLAQTSLKKFAGSIKRMGLGELASGLPQNEWPEWVRLALEASRLAPSAVKRQPWRFIVNKDSVTISIDDPRAHTVYLNAWTVELPCLTLSLVSGTLV